jgi:type VI secretion system lysozyme-like protein
MSTVRKIYNEPKNQIGAKPPLFDRLIDQNLEEKIDSSYKSVLNTQELIDSIQIEVSRILNTRLTAKNKDYDELTQDPLNFGLPFLFGFPDFQSFDGTNTVQWKRIAFICQQAISKFEPRLSDVKVKVNSFNKLTQALEIYITGHIILEKLRETVHFPVILDCSQ